MSPLESLQELHDWELKGVFTSDDTLELLVGFDGIKKTIKFLKISRCYIGDFLRQNIIYSLKIIDEVTDFKTYEENRKFLDERYGAGASTNVQIACIESTLGAYGVIEFDTFEINNV